MLYHSKALRPNKSFICDPLSYCAWKGLKLSFISCINICDNLLKEEMSLAQMGLSILRTAQWLHTWTNVTHTRVGHSPNFIAGVGDTWMAFWKVYEGIYVAILAEAIQNRVWHSISVNCNQFCNVTWFALQIFFNSAVCIFFISSVPDSVQNSQLTFTIWERNIIIIIYMVQLFFVCLFFCGIVWTDS